MSPLGPCCLTVLKAKSEHMSLFCQPADGKLYGYDLRGHLRMKTPEKCRTTTEANLRHSGARRVRPSACHTVTVAWCEPCRQLRVNRKQSSAWCLLAPRPCACGWFMGLVELSHRWCQNLGRNTQHSEGTTRRKSNKSSANNVFIFSLKYSTVCH